jgi:hypothetical protein
MVLSQLSYLFFRESRLSFRQLDKWVAHQVLNLKRDGLDFQGLALRNKMSLPIGIAIDFELDMGIIPCVLEISGDIWGSKY